MTIVQDYSGQCAERFVVKPLWPSGSAGNGAFIQNRSLTTMEVIITYAPGTPPLVIVLPGGNNERGAYLDDTQFPAAAQVDILAYADGAEFTAFRCDR